MLYFFIIKRCKHKVASDAPPGPLFPPAHPRVFLFMRVFLMRRRRRRRRRLFPLTLIALDFDEIFFDCDDVCNPLFPLTAFFLPAPLPLFFLPETIAAASLPPSTPQHLSQHLPPVSSPLHGRTMGQNRKKHRMNSHLINHRPTSEGVSK